MASESKAAVLVKNNVIEIQTFPLPMVSHNDAVIKVERAGICGTDVSLLHGKVKYADFPLILGHEITGEIVEIGKDAASRWNVNLGDRVAVEGVVRCGFCEHCIVGTYRWCENIKGYGTLTSAATPPYLWGSYSEYMYVAPGSQVYKIPDGMSKDVAILLNVVIANAIQWTVRHGNIRLGDVVVIQGCGPLGLACAAVAREAGAKLIAVTGLGKDARRLEFALKMGADLTINVEAEDPVEALLTATGGRHADLVLDITGSEKSLQKSCQLVRVCGTIVNAGVSGDSALSRVPMDTLLMKEIHLQSVFTNERWAMLRAIDFTVRTNYPFDEIVTHWFPLSDSKNAILAADRDYKDEDPIKVVITPNGI
jgi:alcohol dehydrogenase